MKLAWAVAAEQDHADIFDFISADNPLAAIRMDELFDEAAGLLAAHPLMGRTGKIPGTHELIAHESYRLVYETDEQTVRLVSAYLDVAESMAVRQISMTMQDWESRLNRFIEATDREVFRTPEKSVPRSPRALPKASSRNTASFRTGCLRATSTG